MNHVWVHVWPVVEIDSDGLAALGNKIRPLTDGAGIEEVLAQGRVLGPDGTPVPVCVRFGAQPGAGVVTSVEEAPTDVLKPLDDYAAKVLRARRRGLVYPYELAPMLAGPGGSLVEHDLDDTGALVPVERPRGQNTGGHHRRRRHDAHEAAPRRRHPRRALRGPDEVARLCRRGRVPADHRGVRPG